jgi:hypothetical protein
VLRFGGGLFHENALLLHEATIRENGLIANSFAAELAVAHLLAPPPASAQISYPPPAEAIDHTEVARIISTETGPSATNTSPRPRGGRNWRSPASKSDPASPINTAMAQHISTIGAALS